MNVTLFASIFHKNCSWRSAYGFQPADVRHLKSRTTCACRSPKLESDLVIINSFFDRVGIESIDMCQLLGRRVSVASNSDDVLIFSCNFLAFIAHHVVTSHTPLKSEELISGAVSEFALYIRVALGSGRIYLYLQRFHIFLRLCYLQPDALESQMARDQW